MKFKVILLFLMATMLSISSIYSVTNSESGPSVDEFLKSETTEARNMLSGFSNEFLDSYAEEYKNSLKPGEARKLWLLEEAYKRKADKVAADRLFYVFLAVSLLMILILLLTVRIYQMQKKLENLE